MKDVKGEVRERYVFLVRCGLLQGPLVNTDVRVCVRLWDEVESAVIATQLSAWHATKDRILK